MYINFITARGDLFQWGDKVMQSLASKIGFDSKDRIFFDYHMHGLYSNHGPDTMGDYIIKTVNEIKGMSKGKYSVSCTEWSLSIPKSVPPTTDNLKQMLKTQLEAFKQVQCENYFWSWNMSYEPKNEWSLNCITGGYSPIPPPPTSTWSWE